MPKIRRDRRGNRDEQKEDKQEGEEEKKYDLSYFLALTVCTWTGFVMDEEEAKRGTRRGGVGCRIL